MISKSVVVHATSYDSRSEEKLPLHCGRAPEEAAVRGGGRKQVNHTMSTCVHAPNQF